MANLWHWKGRQIFDTVEDRDRAVNLLADFVDARRGVIPRVDATWGNGIETHDPMQGEAMSGPGLTWSCEVPDEHGNEASQVAGQVQNFSAEGDNALDPID